MALVRSANTQPELLVRRALHARRLRFRLHRKDLPGSPDLVLPGRRLVVFVHGCFWHRHPGCKATRTPKTRRDWWVKKFAENVNRDKRNRRALSALGWRVVVIWECDARNATRLGKKVEVIVRSPVEAGPANRNRQKLRS